ncbi:MAG: T9SS type A sorting domain-containing protein [Prevotella sp.]|nr:T9SS type A sorting domain-containing protein [Prevotella sp.]
MKTKLRIIQVVALAVIVSLSGVAANPVVGDYLYLFTRSSSKPSSYSLTDLDKITFSDKGLNLWASESPTEYAYSNFRLITFSEDTNPTGIEEFYEDKETDIKIKYDKMSRLVTVESDSNITSVTIYDAHGRLVDSQHGSSHSYKLSLIDVSQGIYIIKASTDNKTVTKKIAK